MLPLLAARASRRLRNSRRNDDHADSFNVEMNLFASFASAAGGPTIAGDAPMASSVFAMICSMRSQAQHREEQLVVA